MGDKRGGFMKPFTKDPAMTQSDSSRNARGLGGGWPEIIDLFMANINFVDIFSGRSESLSVIATRLTFTEQ